GLIALPAVLVGTWLGARMGDRFSKKVLRKLIFALLWLIAGINLVAPFV
ncbi:MAG: putative membrane protein YfcA, partial [Verrucomicrobiales bacterium]